MVCTQPPAEEEREATVRRPRHVLVGAEIVLYVLCSSYIGLTFDLHRAYIGLTLGLHWTYIRLTWYNERIVSAVHEIVVLVGVVRANVFEVGARLLPYVVIRLRPCQSVCAYTMITTL